MELPAEIHDKFHEFVDGLNELVNRVFEDDIDTFSLVFGVQWGALTEDRDDLPACLVSSNLPICLVPNALEAMQVEAERNHEEYHGGGEGRIVQNVALDSLPEDVRETIAAKLAELGIDPQEASYTEVIDTSDLDALPETED